MKGIQEIIELNNGPWDILALDKNRVVCSNYISNCLTLYDQNLNLIRKVDFNGEGFTPCGLACSDNHLYIVDQQNNRILMTDFKFNKIKSVGSFEIDNDQFISPRGICLKNEILYICEYLTRRIQVYSQDLEFIKSES